MMLALTSCSLGIANVVVTPTDSTTKTTTTTSGGNTPTFATTTTTITPLVINNKQDLLKADADIVYPAVIQIGNYIAGVNIQTWYLDDKTPVFGHNSGDVMCVEIYNANDYNAVFSLQYADITAPSTFDNGSIVYQPEPDAVNWVTIAHPTITLLAHQLLGIPISLNVPVGTVCPPDWEFRITITDVTNEGQIYTNQQVRFLVHMMQPQVT